MDFKADSASSVKILKIAKTKVVHIIGTVSDQFFFRQILTIIKDTTNVANATKTKRTF